MQISIFAARPKFHSATQIIQHDMNYAALPHPASGNQIAIMSAAVNSLLEMKHKL